MGTSNQGQGQGQGRRKDGREGNHGANEKEATQPIEQLIQSAAEAVGGYRLREGAGRPAWRRGNDKRWRNRWRDGRFVSSVLSALELRRWFRCWSLAHDRAHPSRRDLGRTLPARFTEQSPDPGPAEPGRTADPRLISEFLPQLGGLDSRFAELDRADDAPALRLYATFLDPDPPGSSRAHVVAASRAGFFVLC